MSDTADAASGKGVCTAPATSNTVAAEAPMNPQAAKGAVSADGTSVTLNGTVHLADSVQWQVADTESATNKNDPSTATYKDIAGGTTLSIVYGSFQTDDPDPVPVTFQLNGVPYSGLQYTVYVRMKSTRTLNGLTCVDYSNILTISQIVATDPAGHGNKKIK